MTTGGGGLDGEAGHDLAPHVGQVGQPARSGRDVRRRRRAAARARRAASTSTSSDRCRTDRTSRRATSAGLGFAPRRHDRRRSRRARRRAARCPAPADRAVEPELAEEGQPVHGVGRHRFRGHQHADGDGEVEPGPALAHARRREVDGDAASSARADRSTGARRRTRSRDSRQASSGRPTTLNAGRPLATWTSTETGRPSAPSNVADGTMASTAASLRRAGTHPSGRGPRGRARRGAGKPVAATVAGGCDRVRRTVPRTGSTGSRRIRTRNVVPRRPRSPRWAHGSDAAAPGQEGKSLVVTSVRPSGGRAFLQGCAQLHTTADDDTALRLRRRAPSPDVGAHARRPARPRGARRRRLPRRSPAGRLPGRRPLLHGVGLPHHPAHPRRPQPPPVPPGLVLGPPGPAPAAGAVAAAGRPDPLLAVAGRAQLRGQPAPVRGGHGHLHRQLVAALRPGLLLGGVRDAVAAQPHVEPGHRGAVLRDVADRRPDRVEGRPPAGPGAPRCRGRRHRRVRSSRSGCSSSPGPTAPAPISAPTPGRASILVGCGAAIALWTRSHRVSTGGVALAPPAGAGRRWSGIVVVWFVGRPGRVALPRRVPPARPRRRADPRQQRRADAQPAQPRARVGAARADRPGQLRHLPLALAGVHAARAGAAPRATAGSSS